MSTYDVIYREAHEAGCDAVEKANVVPMIVGTPSTTFGNDIDHSKPTYYVADGVCGFAWVNVKPGNSGFAKYLKSMGRARKDSYYGGVSVWISDYNQSMQRKETYAHAFARVLNSHGINAYSMSRMD